MDLYIGWWVSFDLKFSLFKKDLVGREVVNFYFYVLGCFLIVIDLDGQEVVFSVEIII